MREHCFGIVNPYIVFCIFSRLEISDSIMSSFLCLFQREFTISCALAIFSYNVVSYADDSCCLSFFFFHDLFFRYRQDIKKHPDHHHPNGKHWH